MSQTQPELIDAITDLFGDSDSDDDLPLKKTTTDDNLYDSDSDNNNNKSNNNNKFKKIQNHDEDNLFQSDDDDNNLHDSDNDNNNKINKRSRLQKNSDSNLLPIKKKQKLQKQDGNEKKQKKQKKDRSEKKEKVIEKKGIHDNNDNNSGDEYDSETDVVKTREDDEFIDGDDDDADLLQEYENDNQDFNDERPTFSRGKGGANGLLPSSSDNNSKNTPKIEDDPLSQALADMKKRKTKELTETQKGDIAHDILHKMDKAFQDDRLLYEQQLPAINKLKLLPYIKKILLMKQLQSTLLEYDLLSVLKSWIEPIDKTSLVGLTIRTEMYHLLSILPCLTEHIKRSGIGKVLILLLKHKMETNENKQILRDIVEKWSRPIFGKSLDARSLDKRHKEKLQTDDEIQYIQQRNQQLKMSTSSLLSPRNSNSNNNSSSSTNTNGNNSSSSNSNFTTRDEDITALLSSKIETTNDVNERVRLPVSNGFLFTNPIPKSTKTSSNSGGIMSSKKENDKGKRQDLTKSLKQLRSDSGKKTFRIVQAAVSGRDKA